MRLTSWQEKGLTWGSLDEITGLQTCVQNMITKKIKLVNVIQVMLIRRILPCQRRTCYLWEYDPAEHQTLRGLFVTMHKGIWKALFKASETPPPTTENHGLSSKRQANSVSLLMLSRYTLHQHILRMDTELLRLLYQAWIEVAEQISCPAPLPEEEESPVLTKMLFPAPYDVPEKTAKKAAKGAKKGPCEKGAPDMSSKDETSSSSDDDDEEEEEENDSPPEVGRKKRAAPRDPEAKAPKRVKGSQVGNSVWDIDSSPERPRRTKPRAAL